MSSAPRLVFGDRAVKATSTIEALAGAYSTSDQTDLRRIVDANPFRRLTLAD